MKPFCNCFKRLILLLALFGVFVFVGFFIGFRAGRLETDALNEKRLLLRDSAQFNTPAPFSKNPQIAKPSLFDSSNSAPITPRQGSICHLSLDSSDKSSSNTEKSNAYEKEEPFIDSLAEDYYEDEEEASPIVQSIVAKKWRGKNTDQKQQALKSLVFKIKKKPEDSEDKTTTFSVPDELRDIWFETEEEEWSDGGIGDDEDFSSLTPEDISNAINIMTAALEDEDAIIRDAAFSALLDMPREAYELLSQLLLTEDDEVLKLQLIEHIETKNDDFSVMLLMQALDDEAISVQEKASHRLSAMFNLDFSSSQAAYDWWEQNHPLYEVEVNEENTNQNPDNRDMSSAELIPL